MFKIGNTTVYDLEDLCKMFKAKPDTMRRLLSSGKIRYQKVGKKRYVTEKSLREFLEDRKGEILKTDFIHTEKKGGKNRRRTQR